MAFGIKREELTDWKARIKQGEIAILTHYWQDERFPGCTTVTKVGCMNTEKLKEWGAQYNLESNWIHYTAFPHFDLFGDKQKEILFSEKEFSQIQRFSI